ncbi:hypothetical protein [Massilia agri]|uniref:Uncharacterized protein n=1 Tax=Massilia agri TaxID=1886785 RepID=A0ABT2ANL4_9BURK|nr:hypothetical protein [Massilia agri]MCS0597799.1 hypothetical protein [Massilia agri]
MQYDDTCLQSPALPGRPAVLSRDQHAAAQPEAAAVLACGSAFDFDLHLAVGLLKEQVDELDAAWTPAVASVVGENRPAAA